MLPLEQLGASGLLQLDGSTSTTDCRTQSWIGGLMADADAAELRFAAKFSKISRHAEVLSK
jgi:hypothetical protein